MSLLLIAAATAAAQPIPVNVNYWIRPADIPRRFRSRERAAQVDYRLQVDERGIPTGCAIERSSGIEGLDEHTCRLLLERARFHPVQDSEGRTTASEFRSAVVWSSVDHTRVTADLFGRGWDRTTFRVSSEGLIESCSVEEEGPRRWNRRGGECADQVGRSTYITTMLAPRYETLIFRHSIEAPGESPPEQAGAEPLFERYVELGFRARGRLAHCTPLSGFGQLEIQSLCERYPVGPARGPVDGQRWVHRLTIFGIPRQAASAD